MPDVPVEDQTNAMEQGLLGDRFPFKFSVKGVTLSVEVPGIIERRWQHRTGNFQDPVTRSHAVYMGPVDNLCDNSYWIETDLSYIWAFKSSLSRNVRQVKVAKLAIQATAPVANGQVTLERKKGQCWMVQMSSADTITGFLPIEAISIDVPGGTGFVAVTLQNQRGNKKTLMHCHRVPYTVLTPAPTW